MIARTRIARMSEDRICARIHRISAAGNWAGRHAVRQVVWIVQVADRHGWRALVESIALQRGIDLCAIVEARFYFALPTLDETRANTSRTRIRIIVTTAINSSSENPWIDCLRLIIPASVFRAPKKRTSSTVQRSIAT